MGHASPAGGSITGGHIMRMFEKLGIADQITPKTKLSMGGPNSRVSVLVSSGEAEIGLQQASELLDNPDVEVIGMLPPELQQITVYSAGITANAKAPDAAQALIARAHHAGSGSDLQGQGTGTLAQQELSCAPSSLLPSLLVATGTACAAEIKALITTAMEAAIVELVPPFERATGHKVTVSYDPSGGLARRLRSGEFADMILIASSELDKLIAEGKVKDRTDVSRTGIALAVSKGAPHPDVSTPEALKRALLAAKSIGHTAPAGGGITALHVQHVFERLGIAEQVCPRSSSRPAGRTAASACWWRAVKPRSACSRSRS